MEIGWPAVACTITFPRRSKLWLTGKSTVQATHLTFPGYANRPPRHCVSGFHY